MSPNERPQYTFGDTPLAATRLQLVAQVFEPASRAFLTEAVASPPDTALDLGCGPGASTRLVAEVTRARHTTGLDVSDAFLEIAAVDAPAGIEFARARRDPAPVAGRAGRPHLLPAAARAPFGRAGDGDRPDDPAHGRRAVARRRGRVDRDRASGARGVRAGRGRSGRVTRCADVRGTDRRCAARRRGLGAVLQPGSRRARRDRGRGAHVRE